MNEWPTLIVWLQLLGLLAVEVALVAGTAALISRRVASAFWRRTVWQVCVLSLLALTLSELTGAARSVAGWLAVKVRLTNRFAAKPTAANPTDASPASGQATETFQTKGATQLENQPRRAEPAEPTPVVVHRLDFKPAHAPLAGLPRQRPVDRADADGDSLGDALAILGFELIWLLGTGLVLARGCVARVLFALFRRRRQALSDPELRRRVEALAKLLRIQRRILLLESSRLTVPIVFGVFRPVIGLPPDFARRYSPVQQEAMLAHELAHLAAHDPAWYLLADWASAILWWHPMVWWARRRLRAASEMAADEASLVVGDGPVLLAECLAEMGARLTQPAPSAWLGIEGNGLRSSLGRRVERLLHLRGTTYATPGRLRATLARTLGPVALAATAILSTAWAGPQAFTKGESMKTMKQTWSRSLAAFVLLTSLGTDSTAPIATAADQSAERKVTSPGTEPASAAKEPVAPESEQRVTVSPQQQFYYRLMMERYGIKPPGAGSSLVDPRRNQEPDGIARKLEKIVLDEVRFDGLPLADVLRFLDEESRKRDPEKKGINFLINPNTTQSAPMSVIDPQTGQPINLPTPEPMDMSSVIVRFNLPLREVRLKDVLDAIVKVADKPVEYSIEEYGVLFSQGSNQSIGALPPTSGTPLGVPLQVRTFKMDPDKLLPGLKRTFGIDPDGYAQDRPKFNENFETKYRVPTHAEFVNLVTNDLIIEGTINYNPQTEHGLNEITGRYWEIKGPNDKVEVPFKIKIRLLPDLEKMLWASGKFKDGPNARDAGAQTLRQEVENLEKTLTNLLAQFTSESVYVKKVRARIAELKEAMKGRLSSELAQERQIRTALQQLLTQLGVNMDAPGKALFYNDLTGVLMVRATTEDLAMVQGAVETLGGVANEPWPPAASRVEGATLSPADMMRRRYDSRSALFPPNQKRVTH